MRQQIENSRPVPLRYPKGSTVTFINQNAGPSPEADIYFSTDRNQLQNWPVIIATGVYVPAGTQLKSGGTVLQYPNFPGLIWARAMNSAADIAAGITSQELEVLP
jgi:hypothetical protein